MKLISKSIFKNAGQPSRWRLAVFAVLAAIVAGLAPRAHPALAQTRAEARAAEASALEIVTSRGEVHSLQVEVARTPEEQSRGLMFRRGLAPDAGMLFLNDPPRVMTMWMRNTILPLDMIFFDPQGRVTRIVERTVPFSEAIIPSGGPVRGVLEVNAGTAARLGLKPGDRIAHPAVGQAGP